MNKRGDKMYKPKSIDDNKYVFEYDNMLFYFSSLLYLKKFEKLHNEYLKNEYKKQYSDHAFRNLICSAFTTKYAAKTQLYADIKAWSMSNSFDIMAQ